MYHVDVEGGIHVGFMQNAVIADSHILLFTLEHEFSIKFSRQYCNHNFLVVWSSHGYIASLCAHHCS
jgi:hypothetical protein